MAPGEGPNSPLRRPLWVALIAIGLLIVAGAATPEGWAFIDTEGPRRIVVPDPPAIFGYTLILIAICTAVFMVFARARAIKGGMVHRRPRKRSPVATILIMIILIGLWATSPRLQDWLAERLGGDESPPVELQNSPEDELPEAPQKEPSAAFGFAITAILFLLIATATVGALWLFRPEPEESTHEDVSPELLASIERGIDDLAAIKDPRAAVIACYARLEEVSAASGVPRRPSDTPFEHLARLLERHNVTGPCARRLTELFEQAKFSNKEINESTRTEALEALEDVRAQLGALV